MKITVLVENTKSKDYLISEHGLSLLIETENDKILFDCGKFSLFYYNAKKCGINLSDVTKVIISHGHYDHGGGLKNFMKINKTAKIYIQEQAFLKHYKKYKMFKVNIGINLLKRNKKHLTLLDGNFKISDNLFIVSKVSQNIKIPNYYNHYLYEKNEDKSIVLDDFKHEQSLLIQEGEKNILFTGCAHCGILNIIKKAEEDYGVKITHCIGGMHLFKTDLSNEDDLKLINDICKHLKCHGTNIYTCHCTGIKQYEMIKEILNDKVSYIRTGDEIEI